MNDPICYDAVRLSMIENVNDNNHGQSNPQVNADNKELTSKVEHQNEDRQEGQDRCLDEQFGDRNDEQICLKYDPELAVDIRQVDVMPKNQYLAEGSVDIDSRSAAVADRTDKRATTLEERI